MNYTWPDCNRYFQKDYDRLRYPFKGSDQIKNNFSQAFQDMFVLSMLDGKRDGVYVEIGGDHGVVISNTYLLETEFNWKGLSLEIDQSKVDSFNMIRQNKCVCADATTFDYRSYFELNNFPKQIDYLQLDIEPPRQTLAALKALPIDDYRFSVITYETDLYAEGPAAGNEARSILLSKGYQLVIQNVANCGCPFEDWYVDPNVINHDLIKLFIQNENCSIESIECMLL